MLPKAWKSAHFSLQADQALSGRGYDEVYIFNGRHCCSRPFCDIFSQSARVWRYEQGATGNSFVMADR